MATPKVTPRLRIERDQGLLQRGQAVDRYHARRASSNTNVALTTTATRPSRAKFQPGAIQPAESLGSADFRAYHQALVKGLESRRPAIKPTGPPRPLPHRRRRTIRSVVDHQGRHQRSDDAGIEVYVLAANPARAASALSRCAPAELGKLGHRQGQSGRAAARSRPSFSPMRQQLLPRRVRAARQRYLVPALGWGGPRHRGHREEGSDRAKALHARRRERHHAATAGGLHWLYVLLAVLACHLGIVVPWWLRKPKEGSTSRSAPPPPPIMEMPSRREDVKARCSPPAVAA